MNSGRFFLPRLSPNLNPMMATNYLPSSGGVGFFGKLSNSLKLVNWSGILNGANKTLNVVNQTIPLIRQAGPMLNNMRSMIKLTKAFGNQTVNKNSNISNYRKNVDIVNGYDKYNNSFDNLKKTNNEANYSLNSEFPVFFV